MAAGPILLLGGALLVGLVLAASGAKAEPRAPGGAARAPRAPAPVSPEEEAGEVGEPLTEDEAWDLVAQAQASGDPDEIGFIADTLEDGGFGEGENDLASELDAVVELYRSAIAATAEDVIVELLNAGFSGLANLLAEEFDLERGPTESQAKAEFQRAQGFSDVHAVGSVMEMLFSWGHAGLGNRIRQVIELYSEGLGAPADRLRTIISQMQQFGFDVLAGALEANADAEL